MIDCAVLISMLEICITEVGLSGGKKSRVFSGTKKKHSCCISMVAACVQLSEQKEKVHGFCSHFMRSIASVLLDGDWPSLSVQKLSLTSPAGDNVTRWAALVDPCLEQVTELQPAPHVG